MENLEEFDKLKTKVLKYVLYKKRTEAEIKQKFQENAGKILDNVIEYLKENNYINDYNYIERAVNEFKNLKNMSIKEIKYKLLSKGISKDIIDNYIYENREELLEYENNSANNIFIKKKAIMQKSDIIEYLRKKGYMEEIIKIVGEDNE